MSKIVSIIAILVNYYHENRTCYIFASACEKVNHALEFHTSILADVVQW